MLLADWTICHWEFNCLVSRNPAAAKQLAEKLDELNCERRALEAQMQQEAFDIVQNLNLNKKLPLGHLFV